MSDTVRTFLIVWGLVALVAVWSMWSTTDHWVAVIGAVLGGALFSFIATFIYGKIKGDK